MGNSRARRLSGLLLPVREVSHDARFSESCTYILFVKFERASESFQLWTLYILKLHA